MSVEGSVGRRERMNLKFPISGISVLMTTLSLSLSLRDSSVASIKFPSVNRFIYLITSTRADRTADPARISCMLLIFPNYNHGYKAFPISGRVYPLGRSRSFPVASSVFHCETMILAQLGVRSHASAKRHHMNLTLCI